MSVVVAFPHVEGYWPQDQMLYQRDMAKIMIASVRRAMPGAQIWQIAELKTPRLPGVDAIVRRPFDGFWIPWLCDALAQDIEAPRVLYVDTDIVMRKDCSALFNVPADIVLTNRGPKVVADRQQPFLFGCVAYQNRAIWAEIAKRVRAMGDDDKHWWGSQVVAFDLWMEQEHGSTAWKIVSVPCATYNYVPKNADDVPDEAWVIHYKGKRKLWMRDKWAHLVEERVAA